MGTWQHRPAILCASVTALLMIVVWREAPPPADNSEPIDLVYTWVNGSELVESMSRFSAAVGAGMGAQRWRDWNELKYALRSMEANAPIFRRVILAVNNADPQYLPEWLNTSHPRLTVIGAKEFFRNASHLPTANSRAIEANLHRIPGLSRRYVYCNNDWFFGRPVTRDAFFDRDGRPYYYPSARVSPPSLPPTASSRDHSQFYTTQLLDRITGRDPHRFQRSLDQHAPRNFDLTIMQQLDERDRDEFDRTSAQHVRSNDDLSVYYFYGQYTLNTGTGVSASPLWVLTRTLSFGLSNSMFWNHYYLWLTRVMRPVFYCVNDDLEDNSMEEPVRKLVSNFFESTFPLPSSFERQR